MQRRHFRDARWGQIIPVIASLLTCVSLAGFAAQAANAQSDPATACTNLANLTKFPVTPTRITLVQFNPPGTTSATSTLAAIYHMLKDGTMYKDLGCNHFNRRSTDQQKTHLIKRLADLGYTVEIKPVVATA